MSRTLALADARHLPLAGGVVQTVITSPPYFGLRDYGVDGSIGLEPTPDAYVASLVAVFAEVWRVLRDDGTVWLNLGDSYAANRSYQVPSTKGGPKHSPAQANQTSNHVPDGLKSKDLIGIPWRVAFALQAAGWYLRSDIIWAKPNPMPESVRDRPTRSHEYVFLLTKQEKYYYDYKAVREPSTGVTGGGFSKVYAEAQPAHGAMRLARPQDNGWRNRRSVWTITPQPFRGAHFATFPPALVEPCLLAGSTSWQQDADRSLVLDPFCGSGTVGLVARQNDRAFVGFDLNLNYIQMARRRISGERESLT